MAVRQQRILHVEAGRRVYGGALQVRYLMRGLSARGFDNLLVCPTEADVGRGYPLALGRLTTREAGVRLYPISLRGDLDLRFVPRLMTVIKRSGADLVHVHSRRGVDFLGGLAAQVMRVPAILSRRVDNPGPAWISRRRNAFYTRVVTVSEGIRQVQLREGTPREKLRCVYSAVDTTEFRPGGDPLWLRHAFRLPKTGPVLGVVAQLITRKGHRHLLSVLPELCRRHPGLVVLFLGRGPNEAALKQQVDAMNLWHAVRFAGFRQDLPRLLPALDLLVHPADSEGLGVALLQAAASGLPIVASRVGGIPEGVRHEESGLLVPVGDVIALQNAILTILGNPALALRLGEAGRRLMQRCFSIDAMVQGTLGVYKEVMH